MSDWAHPLLPKNQTPLEAALAYACTPQVDPDVIRSLWSPWQCPEVLLPWLAWAVSVDLWDDRWPLETRRQVVADSLEVHRIKGTVASVKMMLSSLGYPEAEIDEFRHRLSYDGSRALDGFSTYGGRDPFVYRVRLNKLTSVAQAKVIAAALDEVAPVRCQLFEDSLDFAADPFPYDGSVVFDGSYTYGVVHV